MTWIRKDRIWPTIITGILVGNLVLGVVLVRIAIGDDHFAVEPDYYRRAIGWDTVQAQARHNVALGWHLAATIEPISLTSPTALVLHLTDRDGVPLATEAATIEARPIAHASELVRGTAEPGIEPGMLRAVLPFHREGLWELRIAVTRGTERFTETLRLDLSRQHAALLVRDRPGDADPARTSLGTHPE
ncbi:MAG TPA: FixH family protein [Gemmatimonadales bacterium]|nr:FixH family protein [Gemmatimonadales bacterium]